MPAYSKWHSASILSNLRQCPRDPLFSFLLFGVMFASANFGLINQRLAIQAENGQNLFGLRDALLIALLLLFLPTMSLLERSLIPKDGLVACGCMVALAAVNLLRSFGAGRSLHYVLADFAGFVAWCLPFVVAPRVAATGTVRRWWTIVCWLGVAVSVCSIIETQLRVPIVTGSQVPGLIERKWARSTPSCWPLMMLASPALLAGCFGKFRERKGLSARVVSAGGWLAVFMASMLTQSRTLLVGLVVGVIALWTLDRDPKIRSGLLLTILTVPMWIAGGAILGERIEGEGFSDYYARRYGVIQRVSDAAAYISEDERVKDLRRAIDSSSEWFLFGVGFAGTYGDPTGEYSEIGERPDSMPLYFATRFGVPGLLLLGWFILINLRLAGRSRQSGLHNNIAAGLVSLLASSMFGDAFATAYMAPVAMTAFSLLVASVTVERA